MPGNQCQLHESTECPCHLQQGVERLKEEECMSAGKTSCSTTRNKSLHMQVYGVCVSCVDFKAPTFITDLKNYLRISTSLFKRHVCYSNLIPIFLYIQHCNLILSGYTTSTFSYPCVLISVMLILN